MGLLNYMKKLRCEANQRHKWAPLLLSCFLSFLLLSFPFQNEPRPCSRDSFFHGFHSPCESQEASSQEADRARCGNGEVSRCATGNLSEGGIVFLARIRRRGDASPPHCRNNSGLPTCRYHQMVSCL